MKPKVLTPFGKEVKKRLIEIGVSQREFCKKHDIPENRFSEMIYGIAPVKKHRDKVARALEIKITA